MIVVDTSALMAVLLDEADSVPYEEALLRHEVLYLSAATRLEATIVAAGRSVGGRLEEMLALLSVRVAPVDDATLHHAIAGFRTYGKGRHPAALNFGDCFAYGLAKATGLPLLFKGDDFSRTDILSALPG